MNGKKFLPIFIAILVAIFVAPALHAQDWVRTGTNLGVQRIRIASARFKPLNNNPQTLSFQSIFDQVLYNDLKNAGIFDVVSSSMIPPETPGTPAEIHLDQWAAAPSNAAMVAFGNIAVDGGRVTVQGYLFDAKNPQTPQILGKQYSDIAGIENTRWIAHRFADEIIERLGGGINGICETHIYYVSNRSGHKEIWVMDYDGYNAHQITHLGTISLSPRVSPDNSRIAFSSLENHRGWVIRMWSLTLNRPVRFVSPGGTSISPAWSSDGSKVAFSSSRTGDNEIYTTGPDGGDLHRITAFRGPDSSPTWNPKTNSQIAWVSGRTGLPQIYTMNADGSNVQRLTDGGYATSPSWSPNGQFLTFAWNRKYGPGAPGGQDIYIMDIASKHWIQLTHEQGANDFPSWAADNRHIVFQRDDQIWSMLADGTDQQQLTHQGSNTMPNWSWK
ncbi:MAG TPA: Tol-Pal system beta propeller repeat protein TolB [Acidobacteriaceae bacterium]|jgi:TolB protein|nr:Tol-Pal system beta propeller repeat protein TolB [Acidobacteriaceae bacterium]